MAGIIIYLIFSAVVGIFVCFCGRKLYLPALGAVLCFFSIAFCLSHFGSGLTSWLIALAVCVVVMLVLKYLFKAGVFLSGAFLGVLLGAVVAGLIPQAGKFAWVMILLFALGCGYCAVKWISPFLAISTSTSGAAILAVTLSFPILKFSTLGSFIYADGILSTMAHLHEYLYQDFSSENPILVLYLTAVLAVVGIYVQLRTSSTMD